MKITPEQRAELFKGAGAPDWANWIGRDDGSTTGYFYRGRPFPENGQYELMGALIAQASPVPQWYLDIPWEDSLIERTP